MGYPIVSSVQYHYIGGGRLCQEDLVEGRGRGWECRGWDGEREVVSLQSRWGGVVTGGEGYDGTEDA